jgi:hypothetical protein
MTMETSNEKEHKLPDDMSSLGPTSLLPVLSAHRMPRKIETMEKMGILDRVRQLDAERATIIGEARAEALRQAGAAIDTLNSLGFPYKLVEGSTSAKKEAKTKSARTPKAGPCPICEFQTDPPHDGRAHRGQKKKAPFTKAELEDWSMVKV